MEQGASAGASLPIDLFVLAATLVYVVVGLIIGVRLLRLARRTRGLPELTLGLGEVLLAGGVPTFFVIVQVVENAPTLVRVSSFIGHLSYTLGCAVMILFTWRVFRPSEGWARALGLAMIGLLALGGGFGMARAFLAPEAAALRDPQTPAFLLMEWVSVAGFFWTAAEAFHHHGRLQRQAVLGLADPVLVNRMLLWALVGVGGVVAAGGPVLVALFGMSAMEHAPTRLVCAFGTLGSSICIQLAFQPPQSYLRWLRGVSA
jgi:hypothetical protein